MGRLIERFCTAVDIVAGVLLGLCTILIVASTASRYLFSWAVPDAFDLSRLLIGACVMWGFASVAYRGGHIAVDLLWEVLSRRWKLALDLFAWVTMLFFTVLLAVMTYTRVTSAYASNESTFDLRLPVWPMLGLIWLGCAASVITLIFALSRVRAGTQSHGVEGQIE
ncbi:TRAP transporter small permease [Chelativorans sp.]|uniref:TRAP transporter small permease n=1 Tax=Chelativorans sp. TaxID=2203393 RepID=UPI0028110506|nr:TRAP transporter small permease [Chelativorans sp.]